MTKKISNKQLAANRNNAKKSSGPRTKAGKARVRANALKHGLTAERVLLRDETEEDFEEFRSDLFEQFAPEGVLEGQLVERLVTLLWRLKRVPAFEAALYYWMDHYELEQESCDPRPLGRNPRSLKKLVYSIKLAEQNGDEDAIAEQRERSIDLQDGRTLDGMFSSGVFDKVIRYETTLQRQLKETLRDVLDLQQKRFDREKEEATKARSFKTAN